MCSHAILLKFMVKGSQLVGFYVSGFLECERFIFILIMVGIAPFCYAMNFMEEKWKKEHFLQKMKPIL